MRLGLSCNTPGPYKYQYVIVMNRIEFLFLELYFPVERTGRTCVNYQAWRSTLASAQRMTDMCRLGDVSAWEDMCQLLSLTEHTRQCSADDKHVQTLR